MMKLDPDDVDDEDAGKPLIGVPSGANATTVANPTATGSVLNESDQAMLMNYKVRAKARL